jgi:uncharacterized membrane protein YfcA
VASEWMALPVGLIIATLATLVGFGGGILWMPYLIFAAGLGPAQAVVTSLIIQVAGMGSGSYTVIQKKKTDLRLSAYLSLCAFPGVPVGVCLTGYVSASWAIFLLGVICLAMGLVFVYTQEELNFHSDENVTLARVSPYLGLSTVFAALTGLLSLGVGDFLVPILRNRLGMKMESAMGACLIVMAANAVLAAVLHLMIGDAPATKVVLWAIPGVLVGGQIGPRLAGKISDQTLKEIFIYGLSLAGIHMMFNIPGGH